MVAPFKEVTPPYWNQHKMKYNPDVHHRQSIRLKEYDYAKAGAYFITICVYQRECLFGEISNGKMILNELGQVIKDEWFKSADIRTELLLDEFVVMPNHLHGIIQIVENQDNGATHKLTLKIGATHRSPLRENGPGSKTLGAFVGGFKSAATKRIRQIQNLPGQIIWQPNYYEHVIRNEDEWYKIREYIVHNPMQWETDRENPNSPPSNKRIESWEPKT